MDWPGDDSMIVCNLYAGIHHESDDLLRWMSPRATADHYIGKLQPPYRAIARPIDSEDTVNALPACPEAHRRTDDTSFFTAAPAIRAQFRSGLRFTTTISIHMKTFDVIVVGGGHAGAEAAWAAANLGVQVALVTLEPNRIGLMPCNPSIGGLAKGQMVREIDALEGLMGLAADATGIMFKELNTSRGPAVRGPRCQCDKHAYAKTVQSLLRSRSEITLIAGSVERVLLEDSAGQEPVGRAVRTSSVLGVTILDTNAHCERELHAPAIVITTGTFMRGLMHRGEDRISGGRDGESASYGIAAWLHEVGFELGRLKTGTPPRLRRSTIDWDHLEPQLGDQHPSPFSELTAVGLNPAAPAFPALAQVECRITQTTPEIHALIRSNLDRAPIHNGQIESAGPRYCPSIEDKVVRFADRESHHVFLEPESHDDESVYCNGISTSLPADIQVKIVRAMPGCEYAEILKFGYAVEYDSVRPHQIDATCMAKRFFGLFFAGQINGTSGYEEAAGQGLLAGLNAARVAQGMSPVTLGRDQAYIGVMMDDLVTRTPVEPYRMFTSRAEHRLLLRADNAPDRLTPLGRSLGLLTDTRWRLFERRRALCCHLNGRIDATRIHGEPLAHILKRPGYSADDLERALAQPQGDIVSDKIADWEARDLQSDNHADALIVRAALSTVLANRQYAGYLARQDAEIRRCAEMESRRIPDSIDYERAPGLRAEARRALARFRPATFGQAGRLEGVTPADLSILMIAAKRGRGDAQEALSAAAECAGA